MGRFVCLVCLLRLARVGRAQDKQAKAGLDPNPEAVLFDSRLLQAFRSLQGETGTQAGELARKYLSSGNAMGIEAPHKIRVAVNTRVARLLGLRLAQKGGSESGIVVLE